MPAFVELYSASTRSRFPLATERVSIGAGATNDIVVGDATASNVHALLELIAGAWLVRDLGSRNGTFLNGERLLTQRTLRDGDEIRVGATAIVYRAGDLTPARVTQTEQDPPPSLTPRERDVLRALCSPVLSGSLLTEPASVAAIAAELVITRSAVKKHLQRLYDKFDLHDDDRRRARLANEAIARGAVSLGELG